MTEEDQKEAQMPRTPKTGGNDQFGYRLDVCLGQCARRAGHPCSISVTLTNSSEDAIQLGTRGAVVDYECELLGPDGEPMPPTRYHELLVRARNQLSGMLETLAPKDNQTVELELSRLFDISLIGEYKVTVKRSLPGKASGEWVTVTSNTLTFELTD